MSFQFVEICSQRQLVEYWSLNYVFVDAVRFFQKLSKMDQIGLK